MISILNRTVNICINVSESRRQYFGLTEDQAPLLLIQTSDGQKYLKANIEPDQIAPWLKDYTVILLLVLVIDSDFLFGYLSSNCIYWNDHLNIFLFSLNICVNNFVLVLKLA